MNLTRNQGNFTDSKDSFLIRITACYTVEFLDEHLNKPTRMMGKTLRLELVCTRGEPDEEECGTEATLEPTAS